MMTMEGMAISDLFFPVSRVVDNLPLATSFHMLDTGEVSANNAGWCELFGRQLAALSRFLEIFDLFLSNPPHPTHSISCS